MIEKIVSYEVGKLAKEKGFKFIWTSDYDLEVLELGRSMFAEHYKTKKIHAIPIYHFDYSGNSVQWNNINVDAPTQSLLQKWLRENFGIHISINFVKNNEMQFVGSIFYKNEIDSRNVGKFKNYEEALEHALNYSLSLI